MSKELDRRDTLLLIGAGIASAGFGLLSHSTDDIFETSIVDATGVNTQSPYELAKSFTHAPTPSLMFMYSMFFPLLTKSGGRPYLKGISEAASKVSDDFPSMNPHRMEALPGVAAAHMLPEFLADPKNRIESRLEAFLVPILNGIRSSNREVNEIVLQNLTNSLPKDSITAKYYVLDANIIEALVNLINRASATPKLILPLTACVNYLLNLRLAISSAQPDSPLVKDVNVLIGDVRKEDSRGLGYVARMIDLHERSFGQSVSFPVDRGQVSSRQIPPQLSELMTGWGTLRGNRAWSFCAPYVEHYILMRARNNFEVWKTLNSLDTSEHPAIQTTKEAARAYPKSLQMCRAYYDILVSHDIPNADSAFRQYIHDELPKILADSNAGEAYPPFDLWLNAQVPLAKFSDTKGLFHAYKSSPLSESHEFSKLLTNVASSMGVAISGALAATKLIPFVNDRWLRSKRGRLKSIAKEDPEELANLTEEKISEALANAQEIKKENLDD